MASYYVPTVVQTTIPDTDMTPLERLVLSHMFTAEQDGAGTFFFADASPAECIDIAAAALRAAHRDSAGADSVLNAIVENRLGEIAAADTSAELDLTDVSWSTIFQDIVRRSATLDEIAVSSAFTCSRMLPDGFGGMATLITAGSIRSCSTDEVLEQFRKELAAAAAPRTHVLLRFDENEVRTMIGEVIAYDDALTTLSPDAVTDDDIHLACLAVAAATQLAEERGSAVFKAALAAIESAEQRRADVKEGNEKGEE